MELRKDEDKSALKLAQCRLFISEGSEKQKDFELFPEGVDLNMKVPSTPYLEIHDRELIGCTLLHLAYKKENRDAFDFLIHKGADFNAKDQSGLTILHKSFQVALQQSDRLRMTKHCSDAYNLQKFFITSVLSAHGKYKNASNPSDPDGITHFHIACATNNVEAVELFLSNGVSINKAVKSNKFAGYSALHFAVEFSCLKIVHILLNYGADVKLKNARGKTPLDVCIEMNIRFIDSADFMSIKFAEELTTSTELNEEVMKLLTKHCDSITQLYAASAMQNSNLDENLLPQVDNTNQCISVDSQNWPGYTALHFAAHVNVDTVKLLMKKGADVESKDANGVTPFDMCVERYKAEDIANIISLVPKWENIVLSDGKAKLVDLLHALNDSEQISAFLEKSIDNIKLLVPFDSPLWPGFTVLHVAVLLSERRKHKLDYKPEEDYLRLYPDLNVIIEILKQGADVAIKDHRNWTPVHLAFRLHKVKIIDLLLQHHHSLEDPIDDDNLSHLHIACIAENSDLVEKLLSNGADANVVYRGKSFVSSVGPGSTPLHLARCEYRGSEILKSLLKFGADPHITDNYGFTPIHNLMGDLFSHNRSQILFSSPNFRDCECESFVEFNYLHVAAWAKNVVAVKKCLDLGMDINATMAYRESDSSWKRNVDFKKFDGDTPLHCSLARSLEVVHEEQLKVVSLLIERGADILIKNARGGSPLEMILEFYYRRHLGIVVATLKNNHELRRRVEAETGITLLHIACYKFDADLLQETLDDYRIDVNKKVHEDSNVWSGCSALHMLMYSYSDIEVTDERTNAFKIIVKILLDQRADVASLSTEGRTPLQIAFDILSNEDESTLSLMLKAHKNFEINPTDVAGISHFHIACYMLDVDVVKHFLEHDVDVNLTIDAFSTNEVPANSPLLLAIMRILRSIKLNNEDELMAKSFAQLEIVDLLLKRGARVDVENLFRNTPAHYAASSYMKESLLQQLVNCGADVNARNVYGMAPLELLIKRKKDDLTVAEYRHFVTCGCRLNAFNTWSEEGYLSIIELGLSAKDMQQLVFETFVNFPKAMERDYFNRTAIHNIVSSNSSDIAETMFFDLLDMFVKFGCDVDDQDNLGRTPLHLSALFRNSEIDTIRWLLLAGADFNKVDNNGKTPFAYLFDSCCRCEHADTEGHTQFDHEHAFKTFASHVQKMQALGLEVNVLNDNLLKETLRRFNDVEHYYNGFQLAVERMVELKIEPYSLTVKDFMSDGRAVVDYPMMPQTKRQVIDEFFCTNKRRIQEEFAAAAGICQLQYRKALKRCGIIDKANESLDILTNFRLPDFVLHMTLKFLRNSDLKNVIGAV